MENWYKITLYRLIEICKTVSSKYTRSKVRKALPADYAYVIEELITEKSEVLNKGAYYESIVTTILEIGKAEDFIIVMSELIQRLVIDHLHIIGDIFDRGPAPDKILDCLMTYHSFDIQWGNHDILWMGAAAGNVACIATVIRICLRYGNLDLLEDGYGINLLPLAAFAMEIYGEDPCVCFAVKGREGKTDSSSLLERRMHKAITIIQFKLEEMLLREHPDFDMEDRCFLETLDKKKGTVIIQGKEYRLKDKSFPTISEEAPYRLSKGEQEIMEKLKTAFQNCEKLQKHVKFLLKQGSLYKVYNGNLLYHGCIPMEKNGDFAIVPVHVDEQLRGREATDAADVKARQGYFSTLGTQERENGQDFLWYLGSGPNSPLFGKDKMATFERYFVADKATHVENKNPYYDFQNDEQTALRILGEFGLSDSGFIINGHVPVKLGQGESPIRAGGRLLVIDGGLSRAYQPVTGIAGYTLIFTSHELNLVAHQPFESTAAAISAEQDIHSVQSLVKQMPRRLLIDDTDEGENLRCRIDDLMRLITAYRKGVIKEARS